MYGALDGLNRNATRATWGATSLSSSNHLPAIVGSMVVKPVALPPGRGKLATKPLPTGSETSAKTIGILRVCSSSAVAGGVLDARKSSGRDATSSLAKRSIVSLSPVAQRTLI